MIPSTDDSVFAIPFRYLWSTNFSGELDLIRQAPVGISRFVGDDSNQVLRFLATPELSENKLSSFWPLVLYGPSGTGKTSLGLAILAQLIDPAVQPSTISFSKKTGLEQPKSKPTVVSAPDFDRRYRAAIATDMVHEFREKIITSSGLMIDDLHLLADKPAVQNELVQIIDQMVQLRRPVILTVDREPQLCHSLNPKLISRMVGGLALPVLEPGPFAREVIIRDLAHIHRLKLTESAVEQLVQQLKSTVPKIIQFFGQLVVEVQLADKNKLPAGSEGKTEFEVDSTFIARMFHRSEEDQMRIGKVIVNLVATEFGLKAKDLFSVSRKQTIVQARCVAIYFHRNLLGLSFLKIGSIFGNRDHSTIMHAYRKIESLFENSKHGKESPENICKNDAKSKVASNHSLFQIQIIRLQRKLNQLVASQLSLN